MNNRKDYIRAAGRDAEPEKPKQLEPDNFIAQLVFSLTPATVLIVLAIIFQLVKGLQP